jgi:hypothetical protein
MYQQHYENRNTVQNKSKIKILKYTTHLQNEWRVSLLNNNILNNIPNIKSQIGVWFSQFFAEIL